MLERDGLETSVIAHPVGDEMREPIEPGRGVVVRAGMTEPAGVGLVIVQPFARVPRTGVVTVVEVGARGAVGAGQLEGLDAEGTGADPAAVRDKIGDGQWPLHHW